MYSNYLLHTPSYHALYRALWFISAQTKQDKPKRRQTAKLLIDAQKLHIANLLADFENEHWPVLYTKKLNAN